MARRTMDLDRWNQTVQAFREAPGDWDYVAEAVGCTPETAKRMWNKGWTQRPWAKPIKGILADEMAESRRRLATEAKLPLGTRTAVSLDAERELAIKIRGQEGQLVGTARGNVIALLAVLNPMLRAGLAMAPVIQRKLEEAAAKDGLDPRVALVMVYRMGAILKQATEAAQRVMEMERLRQGQPQAYLGTVPAADLTPEQAMDRLDHAASVRARAELLGLVALAGGGETTAAPGSEGGEQQPPLSVAGAPAQGR